jgi:phospholipid/cholesterol/gamma-HCH transport system substrate-binding protein
METKANYIATGVFTLAVIVGAFGFIFWFQNTGRSTAQATYRVVFDGSVSGLRTGAAVLFNGIRVGEVADLALDAADPHKVVAVIALGRTVPVRADTKVGLQFQGLTGLAEVSLAGGSVDAAPLTADADAGTPPTLYADASATADVTQQARDVLARINGLVADNESALHLSLRNIETVTSTLADNSARLDKVMEGLQSLAGSGDGNGQIGRAADSIRRLADDLDKNTNDISAGLSQFSNSGLKEFQAFATDGRRTLAELNKAIKNIDQHPSRLIFGH